MALLSRQRGPIVLYGATGYTGKLVAAELADAKVDFVLSGRNQKKLDTLAEDLGDAKVSTRAASLDKPEELIALLEDAATVIDCAGPFTKYGEPVLSAAVATGTHFIDTTGEQGYMRMAFETYGPKAEAAGVAVVPAMGFDYVPGDMLAALTAEGMGEVDEVSLAYAVKGFGGTRGTTLSVLEVLKGDDVEWRKLQWLPGDRGVGRGSFEFPEPVGKQRMVRYPAGEQITVPRHVATRRVRTAISAATLAPSAVGPLMPLFMRPAGLVMKTPAKAVLAKAIERLPEGPSEEDRRAARFTIVCDVTRGSTARRGVIRGNDVYGLTGATAALGGIKAARGEIPYSGALAPSQAFEPVSFLRELGRFEISWEIEAAHDAEPVSA